MDTVLSVRCIGVGPCGPFALASWTLPDDNQSLMQRYPWWVNSSYASGANWRRPRRLIHWAFSGAPSQTATTRLVVEAMRNLSVVVLPVPWLFFAYLTIFAWDLPSAGESHGTVLWTIWVVPFPILWLACAGGASWALRVAGWDRGRCPRRLRRLAAFLVLTPWIHVAVTSVVVVLGFLSA